MAHVNVYWGALYLLRAAVAGKWLEAGFLATGWKDHWYTWIKDIANLAKALARWPGDGAR